MINMSPKHDGSFPEYEDFESKWRDYSAYEQLNGDMGNSQIFHFEHGEWIVVGHGEKTNSKCGIWRRHDICSRAELHAQADLSGVSHAGEVYVHMVHTWCHSYACPVCYLKGACLREAEHISQRIEKASKGGKDEKEVYHAPLGEPQHIIVSAPQSDYNLCEFEHEKWCKNWRSIVAEVGIINGGFCFHGFRFADYAESIAKGVPYGFYWSPHVHILGFIEGGYGKCRHCHATEKVYRTGGGKIVKKHGDSRFCAHCDGFENRVRQSYEKHRYIIKVTDERRSVFATAWYQLSHMAIRKGVR
jgi:hypothetical protein